MKALTLHQPWAELIRMGVKKVETRSWRTEYRGDLAIHAAVQIRNPQHGMRDIPFFVGPWHVLPSLARMQRDLPEDGPPERRDLLGGVILATCKLAEVVPIRWSWEATRYRGEPHVVVRTSLADADRIILRNYRGGDDVDLSPQIPYGDFRPGRYVWLLADITPLARPVVPPQGHHQRLWNLDPATLAPSGTTAA